MTSIRQLRLARAKAARNLRKAISEHGAASPIALAANMDWASANAAVNKALQEKRNKK